MVVSEPYYLAAQVRELDRLAIEEHGIPGFTLMQRAGEAALRALLTQWPETETVVCFCGSGNNGGDGYVIAALAAQRGLEARVIAVGNTDNLHGDARLAFELAMAHHVPVIPFATLAENFRETLTDNTVVVDAMLGTGLSGNVRGSYARAIALINSMASPVLAADIPSGLCGDTGKVLGCAVNADVTVTFIGRKLGQLIGDGPACCGKLLFDDLAVPGEIYRTVTPARPA